MAVSFLAGFLLFGAPKVAAEPFAFSPNYNDTSTKNKLAHIVSNADYNRVDSTELVIYASKPTINVAIISAAFCDKEVTVFNGIRDISNTAMKDIGFESTVSTFTGSSTAGGGFTTVTGVKRDCTKDTGLSAPSFGSVVGSETIAKSTAQMQLTAPASTQPIKTNEGDLYVFKLVAKWNANGACGGVNCGVNSFVVQALTIDGGRYGNGTSDGQKIWISQSTAPGAAGSARNFGINGFSNGMSNDVNQRNFYSYDTIFGNTCDLDNGKETNKKIEIYDDDNFNGPGAQEPSKPFRVRLQESPKGSSDWKNIGFFDVSTDQPGGLSRNNVNGAWYTLGTRSFNGNGDKVGPYTITLKFKATGGKQYKFTIDNVDPHNNLQFSYPYETVWADVNCDTVDKTAYVNVAGVIEGGGDDLEVGEAATFEQTANVYGFPGDIEDWGYTARAEPNSVNTGQMAQRTTYPTERSGVSDGRAVRRCQAAGVFDNPCPSTAGDNDYVCADGNTRDKCGKYRWKCVRSGLADTAIVEQENAPNCNAVQLKCKVSNNQDSSNYEANGDLYWAQDANNMDNQTYCKNKFACGGNDPYVIFTGTNPDHQCRVFNCINPDDRQNFYSAPGEQPKDKCRYRCPKDGKLGFGDFAPLSSSSKGDGIDRHERGDINCYEAPKFQVRCQFDNGVITDPAQDVPRDGNGYCYNYANFRTSRSGPITGGKICATTTPVVGGWVGTPPGAGLNDKGTAAKQRKTWVIVPQTSAPACATVGNKPFVKVYNGDVSSGPYLRENGGEYACVNGPGSVSTRNRGAAGSYLGSGVTDGLIVAGNIGGFRSNNANATLSNRGLTFANNPSVPGEGGQFGNHSTGCPLDMKQQVKTATTVTQNRTSQFVNQVPAGFDENKTYIVNGDLYVDSNISYSTALKSNVKLLPRLKIIVKGNIYIASNVTQVDGILIAVDTDGSKGNMYTCSREFAGSFQAMPQSDRTTFCGSQLRINGAVSAKSVKLLRTYGSLRFANNDTSLTSTAAEIINYGPSVWLPRGSMPAEVNAITSLPPIL
jgi:hypothetical protein